MEKPASSEHTRIALQLDRLTANFAIRSAVNEI